MLFAKYRKQKARKTATRWLISAQAEDFTQEQENQFMHWLSASPMHQAAYIEVEYIWNNDSSMLKRYKKEPNTKVWFFSDNWQPAVAFAILLFVGLGFFYQYSSSPTMAYYQTAVGEQLKVTLSDGSKLTLNTNAAIQVLYTNKGRLVRLEHGEVFFDIATVPGLPFDVRTQKGMVRVLGTQFSVYDMGDKTLVTVLEGKVGLDGDNTSQDTGFVVDLTLTGNQQITMEDASAKVEPAVVNASNYLNWRAKKLVFQGHSLQAVIDEINRYFDTPIILSDRALAEKKVVAVIQITHIQTVVETLEYISQLEAKRDDEGRVVLYPKAADAH